MSKLQEGLDRYYADVQARANYLIEDLSWLLHQGVNPEVAHRQVAPDKSPQALRRYLYRYGRPDLARQINPATYLNKF